MDYSHNGPDRLYGWPPSCLATSRPSPAATRGRSGGGEGGSGNARAFTERRGKARRHVTSCFFRGTWLFPRSTSPSICVRAAAAGAGVGTQAQPRHGFGPQRPAQRQHRGQQPGQRHDAAALHARGHRAGLRQPPAHGAAAHLLRRPALSALRPRQGRVRARAEAFHPHPGHGPHEPVPAHPIAGPPLSRVTHPPGHRSPFPPLASTSVAGLRCTRIWPLLKAGISIVLRGPQTDPATSPPPDPLLRATAENAVRPTSNTKAGTDSS